MSNGHTEAPVRTIGREFSGRRFVIVAVVTIAAIWLTLFLVFRDWRARHRAASEFGRREVATIVDPLADKTPPGVDRKLWLQAVDDSHDMLMTVTGSGMLDLDAMKRLRDRLQIRFAATTPDTAVTDLRWLWNEMEIRAGPVLTRKSQRPPFAPSRPDLLKNSEARDGGRTNLEEKR